VPKAIRFGLVQTSRSHELLVSFRMTVNHAIHICLEEKIKGRLKIRDRIYKEFQKSYVVTSAYRRSGEGEGDNGSNPPSRIPEVSVTGMSSQANRTSD
jgi:hypothetical protein